MSNPQFETLTRHFCKLCPWVVMLVCLLGGTGCKQRNLTSERRAAIKTTLAQLHACLRPQEASNKTQLALREIIRHPDGGTRVRLVAYSTNEASEFYLPTYSLSRGRWLINEKERAYLLDETCQEFKLQDRHSTNDRPLPTDGKISLVPGAAFEFELRFPNLPAEVQMGVLVYGAKVIPFSLMATPASQPD